MDIISRAEWNARKPKNRDTTTWSRRTEFVVHHSEGPVTQSVRSIQDFHMDGNGWSDVGYNFLVDHKGRIYEGRGWLTVGAHAKDHNTSGIGVCVIGRDGKDITEAAKRSVRALYDEACRKAGRTLARKGHGDVNSTSCPGSVLRAWVHAGMPRPGGGSTPAPKPKPSGGKAPKWPGRLLTQPPIMRGSDVRTWQAQMRARGWSLAADGAYGPRSEEVCRGFQREKGLGVDGIVGPKTWAAAWTAPIT